MAAATTLTAERAPDGAIDPHGETPRQITSRGVFLILRKYLAEPEQVLRTE